MTQHHIVAVFIISSYITNAHGDNSNSLENDTIEVFREVANKTNLSLDEFIESSELLDDIDIQLINVINDDKDITYYTKNISPNTIDNVTTVYATDILESLYGNNYIIDDNLTAPNQIYNVQQNLINDMAKTIEFMANVYIDDSQSIERKLKIIEAIESSFRESSLVRAIDVDNSNELKIYDDAITQGIDIYIKRKIHYNDTEDSIEIESSRDIMADNIAKISNYNFNFAKVLQNSPLDPICGQKRDDICNRIINVNTLPCGDKNIVSLDEICNGISDCWNGYDEINCTSKVGKRCLETIDIITDVQTSIIGKCLQSIDDSISYHYSILKSMLVNNWARYTKYLLSQKSSKVSVVKKVKNNALKKLNEIISLVSSVLYGLEDNLCVSHYTTKKELYHESKNLLNYDKVDEELNGFNDVGNWSYNLCSCSGQFCKYHECVAGCKRVCWQKYSLNHYSCISNNGDTGISLNLVCDGKFDCVDKTDESACKTNSSVAKYEANILYNELQEILSGNFVLMKNDNERKKLITLSKLATRLQHIATKNDVSMRSIAKLRKEYFNTIVKFYEDKQFTCNLKELDHLFNFLMTLNEKMVHALKKTYAWDRAACYCYNGTCTAVNCSKTCNETCLLQYHLITYSCDINTSYVQHFEVCDGKNDCPNGKDENGCSKEMCQNKHLDKLRNHLEQLVNPFEDSAPREVLDKWKIKGLAYFQVISSLNNTIKRAKPEVYGGILENTVVSVLQDLVTAYSSLHQPSEPHRSKTVQKLFIKISSYIMDALKYCNIL